MDALVSIIIPVYNLEEYVTRSVDSALNQSYRNIEVILVDDGSTDKSGDICDVYSKKNSRVRVIHKENGGLVSARKAGLGISKGKYIVPLDADDWIDPEMIKAMVTVMENRDIDFAQCGLLWEYSDGTNGDAGDILDGGEYDLSQKDNGLYDNLFTNKVDRSVNGVRLNICSCMFKRDVVVKSQNLIKDELANGEDDALFFVSILISKKFYKFEKAYYHAFVRKNSMSRSKKMYDVYQVFIVDEIVRPVLREHIFFNDLEILFNQYLFNLFNMYAVNYWQAGFEKIYQFDNGIVPNKSKIVLYGAGAVGQSYYILMSDTYNIVAWIDSKKKYVDSIKIGKPEDIKNISYDYVILAVKDKVVALEMRTALIKLGVETERIIWNEPRLSPKFYYLPDRT